MIVLGIDPDTKTPGFAVTKNGVVLCAWVGILPSSKGISGLNESIPEMWDKAYNDLSKVYVPDIDRIVVETQNTYQGKSAARPENLIKLATMTGALAYQAVAENLCRDLIFAEPRVWKGSVPKPVHHARLCKKLKWKYERKTKYCVPLVDVPGIQRGSDWLHAMDAVGLALWGEKQK